MFVIIRCPHCYHASMKIDYKNNVLTCNGCQKESNPGTMPLFLNGLEIPEGSIFYDKDITKEVLKIKTE
jgi:hypothetical protein